VVVSTGEFLYKGMAVAATPSTMQHRTNMSLSNNLGVLKMDITKIPSPFGNRLHQAPVALPVDLPHHLRALMDIHNLNLMATMHLAVGLRAMVMIVDDQGICIEEKMESPTEDSETHTADNTKAVKPISITS
jgi:hypothetical protein